MPNQGVPVIFKNKIAYGYAEKSVQAYDVSVSDYNALTEQQQLDGSIRFIQGVDAIPNGSNVWAKLGTTPLAEGLPRDCSQAVNQLKSNLTELMDITQWNHESVSVTPTAADSTWKETSAFNALKTAKIVAVCTGDLQAIFLNSGGQKIQTFSFMYSASNLTQYSAVIQLRIDFNTGKAGIRQSYKGSGASFSTLTDIYYI